MAAYDNVYLAPPVTSRDYNQGFQNFMQVGNGLAELPDSYFKGKQMGRTLDLQRPVLDENGEPSADFDKIMHEGMKRGGLDWSQGMMKFLYDQKYGGAGGQQNPHLFDSGASDDGGSSEIPHSPYATGPGNLRLPGTRASSQPPADHSGIPADAGGSPGSGEGGGTTTPTLNALASSHAGPEVAQAIMPQVRAALQKSTGKLYMPEEPISDPQHAEVARNAIQAFAGRHLAQANDETPQPQAPAQPGTAGGTINADPGSVAQTAMRGDPRIDRYNKAIQWEIAQAEAAERRKALGVGGGGEAHIQSAKSIQAERDEYIKARTGPAQEQFKGDQEYFRKEYGTYNQQGQTADLLADKIKFAKSLIDPSFYSGAPAQELVNRVKAAAANLGVTSPSGALKPEAFNKLVNDMLINQVRALGQSGVGRVLMTEVQAMRESIASLKITPASNRALLEIVDRVNGIQSSLGQMARGYKGGHLDAGFDTIASSYIRSHPLFKQEELADPRILGAPTMRKGTDKPGDESKVWGLKSGDPFKTPSGETKYVP